MQRTTLNGAEIEYEVRGSGDPLLLIHGSILADAFLPLLIEPEIANRYRVLNYHRRGFAGSDRVKSPFLICQQAADCRALLEHLKIPRAHVAGHSYGAVTALQMALDSPDHIRSLALLEPPLLGAVPSGPAFGEKMAPIIKLYTNGDKFGAADAFLKEVNGDNYRQVIDDRLPAGAFDLALADLDTFFQVEMPALQEWRFTADDAKRITLPVVSVIGNDSAPVFIESHDLVMQWFPQAEELRIPEATHGLQMINPRAIAEGLSRFFAQHAL
jgi:pimeloyl-ACP methyl ester carboxylesterase